FRQVAEASPDSIVIWDGARCVYANPRAVEVYELDRASLATNDWSRYTSPERYAAFDAYVERIRKGEVLPPLVNRRALKNGDTRDFEASLSATTIGGKQAVLVFTRDITE